MLLDTVKSYARSILQEDVPQLSLLHAPVATVQRARAGLPEPPQLTAFFESLTIGNHADQHCNMLFVHTDNDTLYNHPHSPVFMAFESAMMVPLRPLLDAFRMTSKVSLFQYNPILACVYADREPIPALCRNALTRFLLDTPSATAWPHFPRMRTHPRIHTTTPENQAICIDTIIFHRLLEGTDLTPYSTVLRNLLTRQPFDSPPVTPLN